MDFRNLFKKTPQPTSPYDSLTWNQKLAAMNLMIVLVVLVLDNLTN